MSELFIVIVPSLGGIERIFYFKTCFKTFKTFFCTKNIKKMKISHGLIECVRENIKQFARFTRAMQRCCHKSLDLMKLENLEECQIKQNSTFSKII